MTDTNIIVIEGRICRDLEEKGFGYIGSGTAKLNFSIANNKSVKRGETWEEETSFFDVVAFGSLAEKVKPAIIKGAALLITGRLKVDYWEKDGQKKSKVYIVADSVKCVSHIKAEEGASAGASGAQAASIAAAIGGEIVTENIPF